VDRWWDTLYSSMLAVLTVLVSLTLVTVRGCSISCPVTAPPCVDEILGGVDSLCRGFLGCVTVEECRELNNITEGNPSTTQKPFSTTQRTPSTTQRPRKLLKPLKKAISAPYRLSPYRKTFPSKLSWPRYSGQYGQYGGPVRRRWVG